GQPERGLGMRYRWGGVAAGVGLALGLAAVMLGIASVLTGDAMDYFQAAMMLIAAALIIQMVMWMRRHGRTFRRELEAEMQQKVGRAHWWGMLAVVMLAVGRESSEAVVFLYGLGMEHQDLSSFLLVLALGIAAAWATFWLLQQGGKILSWRVFFRVSEILLLLLAGALLVSGIEKLVALGVVPALVDPVWDTSVLLDDSGRVGAMVASLSGYRARPALLPLLCLAAFWVTVIVWLRRQRTAANGQAAPLRK